MGENQDPQLNKRSDGIEFNPRGERGPRGDHGQQGEKGERGLQGEQAHWGSIFKRPSLVIITGMCMLIGIVLIVFYAQLDSAINDINSERAERADQACRGLEAQHAEEVKDLTNTYAFYENPPAEFKNLLHNTIVITQLADQIKAAKTDTDVFGVFVPKYCDEKGVGLAEPDPVVPEVPSKVKSLLSSSNGK